MYGFPPGHQNVFNRLLGVGRCVWSCSGLCFCNKIWFCRMGLLAPCPTPNLEDQGLMFVGSLAVDPSSWVVPKLAWLYRSLARSAGRTTGRSQSSLLLTILLGAYYYKSVTREIGIMCYGPLSWPVTLLNMSFLFTLRQQKG